jgi:hypothetical protein
MDRRSSHIPLCLVTVFIILSWVTVSLNSENRLFQPASAQDFNDTRNGIQNGTAESTMLADRSLIVNLLAVDLENRLNKSAAILQITGELPQLKKNISC